MQYRLFPAALIGVALIVGVEADSSVPTTFATSTTTSIATTAKPIPTVELMALSQSSSATPTASAADAIITDEVFPCGADGNGEVTHICGVIDGVPKEIEIYPCGIDANGDVTGTCTMVIEHEAASPTGAASPILPVVARAIEDEDHTPNKVLTKPEGSETEDKHWYDFLFIKDKPEGTEPSASKKDGKTEITKPLKDIKESVKDGVKEGKKTAGDLTKPHKGESESEDKIQARDIPQLPPLETHLAPEPRAKVKTRPWVGGGHGPINRGHGYHPSTMTTLTRSTKTATSSVAPSTTVRL